VFLGEGRAESTVKVDGREKQGGVRAAIEL